MDIGVAVPQTWSEPRTTIRDLKQYIVRADQSAANSLWVQETLVGLDPSFEPLSALAFAAGITDRIRLGAAGFAAPVRSPLVLAKSLATVDQFSLGRLEAGLVIGDVPAAFAAGGIDWSSRGARLDDVIEVMRSLWRDDSTNHKSPYGSFEAVTILPKPIQPGGPPIWIGGKSPVALDRAARLGDGWMGAGGTSTARWIDLLETFRQRCEIHGNTAARAGKRVYLWINADDDLALRGLAHWLATHLGLSDGLDLTRQFCVWGSVAKVVDSLGELVEHGIDTLILNPVGDELNQLDVIAEDILPQFAHG